VLPSQHPRAQLWVLSPAPARCQPRKRRREHVQRLSRKIFIPGDDAEAAETPVLTALS